MPIKIALPAKKFSDAGDADASAADVTTAVDDPDAAPAAVAFAAEITMLDAIKASAKVGSISKGTPSDLEVDKRIFIGNGANAMADGQSKSSGSNVIVLKRKNTKSVIMQLKINS